MSIGRGVLPLFFLALTTASFGQAQTKGGLTGRIVDTGGGVLKGATIDLQPSGATAVSNNQGEFTVANIPTGPQKVTIAFVGFAPLVKDVQIAAGQTARLEATLEVASKNDSVLVTAERPHGEAEAINRQASATQILQVLPAEVITSLPNANVADALGRLPSVTLERDEGEGKYVQIRGAEPRYSNVTIDGVNVASPENVRQIKLDVVPSDLVESVEINKTLLASMDGDAIGGSVNLRTKTAGEQPTVSLFGIGGGTPILDGRAAIQTGGTLGKRFGKDKKLGILFGGTYDWNGRGIDDIEPGPQTIQCLKPTDCASDPLPNSPTYGTFAGADLREYRYYRARLGFSGSVDYKLGQSSSVYARGLYSNFDNFGDRWVYSPTINSYTSSPLQGGPDGSMAFNASIRRPVQKIGSLLLGGQHYFGTSWITWEASAGRSSTEDQGYSRWNFNPISDSSPLNNVQFGVNLNNPFRPGFQVQNGVNIFDSKQYFLTDYDRNTTRGVQVNLQGGASYAKNYSWNGHFGIFEFGAKVRGAHKFNEANDVFYTINDPGKASLSNFIGGFMPTGYYDNTYQYGATASSDKIRSYLTGNPGNISVNVNKSLVRNTPNNWDIDESISAGFLQNSISFGKFRLYTGLRFEATNEGVRGNLVQLSNGKYIGLTGQTTSSSYVDALPSVQLRYALTPDSGIRVAYGRGIARPDFSQLPPGQTLDDKKNTITAGNPNLKATHANNYDVLYERYLKPLGLISGGFFYKDITDPIYSVTAPVTAGTYAGYSQRQPVNGSSAYLWGFELAYQQRLSMLPSYLGGAGISANYSYTASRANGVPGRTDHPALQRQAPNSWNISPTYDRGRLSLRVGLSYNDANIYSYSYRDGADLGKTGPNGDNYLYSHLQVDAQGSIRLAKGFTAVIYGLNLTNEVFGFYNGSPIWPNQREYYKPTYGAGLRWSSGGEKR